MHGKQPMSRSDLIKTLDASHAAGQQLNFWLRDDDAVEPTPELDRLLALTATSHVPTTLAVIPENTGIALAEHLRPRNDITVAVHGWSHGSHSGPGEKTQELGDHRPLPVVTGELRAGFEKLAQLYPGQFVPIMVPPWNRISDAVAEALPSLGYEALSVYGPENEGPLPLLNTHLDIMNWRTRSGREPDELFSGLAALVERPDRPPVIGVLTHHLVHDEQAWGFLDQLFEITAGHPACVWKDARDILPH
jgi:hypothetical protein